MPLKPHKIQISKSIFSKGPIKQLYNAFKFFKKNLRLSTSEWRCTVPHNAGGLYSDVTVTGIDIVEQPCWEWYHY